MKARSVLIVVHDDMESILQRLINYFQEFFYFFVMMNSTQLSVRNYTGVMNRHLMNILGERRKHFYCVMVVSSWDGE